MSKGANFERQCRQELEAAGWTVIRSAGSHGPADLVAVRAEGFNSRTLWVQVKAGRQSCRPAEWNALVALAEHNCGTPVLADKQLGVRAARWWRITGLKDGRGGAQPRVPFDIHGWSASAEALAA